jgi:hypothetical protein
LEKQLKPQELADLFAFITLDKPPSDPQAKKLAGSQPIVPRSATDPGQFAEIIRDIAPQFNTKRAGKEGIAIVAEHAGREGVLRTTTPSRDRPCVLQGKIDVPAGKASRLVLVVSGEEKGAWNLTVRGNGSQLHAADVSDEQAPQWRTFTIDLTPLAGKPVDVELVQSADDGRPSAAYWAQIELISE